MTQTSTANARLYRRGLVLEYITITYNVVEAAFSIGFGAAAGSIALVGFGLDSVIESLSGGVLLWHLRQHGRVQREEEERNEKRAQRLVAVSFLVLGLYVLFQSVQKLVTASAPEASAPGIVIAAASIVAMPVLWWLKLTTGRRIGSKALMADAKETLVCGLLSVALLIGLGANYIFGFWQADPIVGLVITAFLLREGWEGWKEAGEKEPEGGE